MITGVLDLREFVTRSGPNTGNGDGVEWTPKTVWTNGKGDAFVDVPSRLQVASASPPTERDETPGTACRYRYDGALGVLPRRRLGAVSSPWVTAPPTEGSVPKRPSYARPRCCGPG